MLEVVLGIDNVLILEGWDAVGAQDIHLKNYVYFAMAFSFLVELLNMYMRKRRMLRQPITDEEIIHPSDRIK